MGMGKDFYDSDDECRAMFDEACDVLGNDIKDICFNGPEEVLKVDREHTACVVDP